MWFHVSAHYIYLDYDINGNVDNYCSLMFICIVLCSFYIVTNTWFFNLVELIALQNLFLNMFISSPNPTCFSTSFLIESKANLNKFQWIPWIFNNISICFDEQLWTYVQRLDYWSYTSQRLCEVSHHSRSAKCSPTIHLTALAL